jgi:hypothetical protein
MVECHEVGVELVMNGHVGRASSETGRACWEQLPQQSFRVSRLVDNCDTCGIRDIDGCIRKSDDEILLGEVVDGHKGLVQHFVREDMGSDGWTTTGEREGAFGG